MKSSIGIQSNLYEGKILGTNHYYLHDGIWVRCDCGEEIFECIQADLDDPEKFEYQLSCKGSHSLSREESWNSCFITYKEEIKKIVEVLENHMFSWEGRNSYDSEYWLHITHYPDEDYDELSLSLERRRKHRKTKCLWEIIMLRETANKLAKYLKKMLKEEENYFNGKQRECCEDA